MTPCAICGSIHPCGSCVAGAVRALPVQGPYGEAFQVFPLGAPEVPGMVDIPCPYCHGGRVPEAWAHDGEPEAWDYFEAANGRPLRPGEDPRTRAGGGA